MYDAKSIFNEIFGGPNLEEILSSKNRLNKELGYYANTRHISNVTENKTTDLRTERSGEDGFFSGGTEASSS